MSDGRMGMKRYRKLAVAGLGGAVALGFAGCKNKDTAAPIVAVNNAGDSGVNSADPASGNLAQPYTGGTAGGYGANTSQGSTTRVLGSSQSFAGQSSGESYGDPGYAQNYNDGQAAPIIRQTPQTEPNVYNDPNAQGYNDAEEAGEQALAETDQAPPPLPEYDQPPAPEQNDLWTPGYWNYAQTGYYWVPGAWCPPPFYGALWTPPWWGFFGGHYLFHRGYWGSHIGYYGGINYGFGYIGTGYYGGYWHGHDFLYNRAVTNVNVTNIHNVYNREVVYNGRQYGPHPDDRVSYNGGRGGINVQPRPFEVAADREPHYAPLAAQRDLRLAAASNHSQFFNANGGRPAQAFAARPVGTTAAIAATPREQPFNRGLGGGGGNATGQPGFNGQGHPGFNGQRPGEVAGQGGFNTGHTPGAPAPGFENRPQPAGQQPGFNGQGRPGFNGQRPGEIPGQGGFSGQQPGFNGHQPSSNGQRPAFNGQQPGFNGQRPGFNGQQPGSNGQQPGFNGQRPGAPTAPQPGQPQNAQSPFSGRPGNNGQVFNNHQTPRPGTVAPEVQRPGPTGGQPGFHQPPAAVPAPSRPVPPAPSRPAPSPAPAVQAQRPAPAFQPRPQPVPQPREQVAPQPRPQIAPPPPVARPAAPPPAPRPAPAPAARPAPAPAPAAAPHEAGHH